MLRGISKWSLVWSFLIIFIGIGGVHAKGSDSAKKKSPSLASSKVKKTAAQSKEVKESKAKSKLDSSNKTSAVKVNKSKNKQAAGSSAEGKQEKTKVSEKSVPKKSSKQEPKVKPGVLAQKKAPAKSKESKAKQPTKSTATNVNVMKMARLGPQGRVATMATSAMVEALKATNKAEGELEAAGIKANKDDDDTQTAEFVKSHLNLLGHNENADWIFEASVDSIKTVFRGEKTSAQPNIINTLKQSACVFVAETHYGNLPGKGYDDCDQTNIGQIRPPAYKAIYRSCPGQFKKADLNFLGAGTTCKTLHPYEMPLCCKAVKPGERDYGCQKYHNNPLLCVSKEKRDYLERIDAMSGTNFELDHQLESGLVDPVRCKSTSGSEYIRVPAVPRHSVFASIFYLKLINFTPMSHPAFASFGARRYNGARPAEQRAYQKKLNTCLKILDLPESTKIVEEAYQRIMDKRRQHNQAKGNSSEQSAAPATVSEVVPTPSPTASAVPSVTPSPTAGPMEAEKK